MKGNKQAILDRLHDADGTLRDADGWRLQELGEGDLLWREGEPTHSLAIVAAGQLDVLVEGRKVATIVADGSVGEASVFFPGEARKGTVVATGPARAWVLDRAAIARLRSAPSDGYDHLLGMALAEVWHHLEQKDAEICGISKGQLESAGEPAGPIAKLWQRLTASEGTPPPIAAALRGVPRLGLAPEGDLTAIAAALDAKHVPAQQALFLQGDTGRELFIVASGELAVVRAAAEGTAREIIRLGEGSLFGAGGYVAGQSRSASIIARDDAWVFGIDPDAVAALPTSARRLLHEALLATMRAQLDAANRAFHALARPEEDFDSLMAAVGHLTGWRAGDPGTEAQLYAIPDPSPVEHPDPAMRERLAAIREAVIGKDVAIDTPFGLRRMVYADYTASGRGLAFIEDFIRDHVLPLYANTHTEASASGLQTTHYREQARAAVASSVNAGDDDEVIFVGSGATGAVHKLIALLGLAVPDTIRDRVKEPAESERPVVFIGPYEHHSNILPWRHSIADVVTIGVDADGGIDLDDLENNLKAYAKRPLRIGSFSAASNVTGIASDVVAIASLLHRHGALSLWDYAAAGPYVPIDMNPSGEGIDASVAYKDAVFISPHKFVGGPGTPGVLILKKNLAKGDVPTQPGGGTVDFVTGEAALYSDSLTHREEPGTPAIVESIRCGLVFQLKDDVGGHTIHGMEQRFVTSAIDTWSHNPAIRVLGSLEAERLSIVSFMVRHGRGFLHHNFIVALLNDLFGVQARGGCSCAGPYGGLLLGMSEDSGEAFTQLADEGYTALKPGWARVNFNYFISHREFRYVVTAAHLVAVYGFALLPAYELDIKSGLWRHRGGSPYRARGLSDLRFDGARFGAGPRPASLPESVLSEQLAEGQRVLREALDACPDAVPAPEHPELVEKWRWFPLPHEVAAWLRRRNGDGQATPASQAVQRGVVPDGVEGHRLQAFQNELAQIDDPAAQARLRALFGVSDD